MSDNEIGRAPRSHPSSTSVPMHASSGTGLMLFLLFLHLSACSQTTEVKPVDNGKAVNNPNMGWNLAYYTDDGNNYGNRLKKGDVAPTLLSNVDIEGDTFIKGYSAAITDKELAMAGLMSQGFMPEHPQIKNTQREIENLKILREQRAEELLSNPALSSTVKIAASPSVPM